MSSLNSTTAARDAVAHDRGGAGRAPDRDAARDAGLLVLRLVLGLTLAAHGTQKLFGWFSGGGLDGTGAYFSSVGYPHGRVMAVVAGTAEGAGGLGLALGLLTPLAGAAVFCTMLNVLAVTWGGFFAPKGVEFPMLLTAGAVALTLAGPGRWAADRWVPVLWAHRPSHGVAALLLGALCAGAVLLLRFVS